VNTRRARLPSDLHRQPPLTLHDVRERLPWLLPGAVAVAILMGVAAAVDGGRLLVWDAAVTDAAVHLRRPGVDRAALWLSRLGSTPVAAAAGVALAARRCRSVALVMLATVAARPPRSNGSSRRSSSAPARRAHGWSPADDSRGCRRTGGR
jgi:hypothetical protein